MADEIAVSYITGQTLTADVFQPDGSVRETAISLTENATGGLYLGDCATISAGDLVVAYDSGDYIGGQEYLPELYNLDTRLDSIDTDLADILAAERNVTNVYDDTDADSEATAAGVYPEKC